MQNLQNTKSLLQNFTEMIAMHLKTSVKILILLILFFSPTMVSADNIEKKNIQKNQSSLKTQEQRNREAREYLEYKNSREYIKEQNKGKRFLDRQYVKKEKLGFNKTTKDIFSLICIIIGCVYAVISIFICPFILLFFAYKNNNEFKETFFNFFGIFFIFIQMLGKRKR